MTDWALFLNWINPPFRLIGRVLHVMSDQRATGILIAPYWRGQHWWPLLVPDGVHFAAFVTDWRELPVDSIEAPAIFMSGAGSANEESPGPPLFRVLALRISFVSAPHVCLMRAGTFVVPRYSGSSEWWRMGDLGGQQ